MKGKRILALMLCLLMVFTSFGTGPVVSFAADYPGVALVSDDASLVSGETDDISLSFAGSDIGFGSMEFTLEDNGAYTVESVSLGDIHLSETDTYAVSNGTIGVLAKVQGGMKVGIVKVKAEAFAQPLTITIRVTAVNPGTVAHVLDTALKVSGMVILKVDGSVMSQAPTEVTLTQKVLSQTIKTKIDQTNTLITALPDTAMLDLDALSLVNAARSAYSEVTTLAGSETVFVGGFIDPSRLLACEAKLSELTSAAKAVEDEIIALPVKETATLNNKTAIDTAKGHFDALTAPQQSVVSQMAKVKLTDLLTRLSALDNGKVSLLSNIESAEAAKDLHPVGIKEGEVTQGSMDIFVAAIAAAQGVYDTAETKTLTQLDTAIGTLTTAKVTFVASALTALDEKKAALNALIQQVETLYGSAVAGDQAGQYPASAKTALKAMLDDAKATSANGSSTLDQLNGALTRLSGAKTTFEASVITALDVAKRLLTAEITKAEGLISSSVVGEALGQYPQAAKTELMNDIAAAKLTDMTSEAAVNTAKTNLTGAIATFEATQVTALTIVSREVAALFTSGERTALAPTVTAARLAAVKSQCQGLQDSPEKTGLLADIGAAEGLFNTPVKVAVFGGTSVKVGSAITLTAKAYNALNIELAGKTFTWGTSQAGFATVNAGVVTGVAKGSSVITATVTGTDVKRDYTVTVIELPALIVSNIPQGAYYNQNVVVNLYFEIPPGSGQLH